MTNVKLIEQAVHNTAMEAAKEVVFELKRQRMIKDNKHTPFQKTETLLYNYNNFQQAIKDKYKQIETVQIEGIQKKSHSITSFNSSKGMRDSKTEYEQVEEKIEALENSIMTTRNLIEIIDDALQSLEKDPYYDIIRLKYFEGSTGYQIAEFFNVDEATVSRNKNRLINILQVRLFSDEVIDRIFN